ncbi:MAG: MFS transporter [Rhodospirillaceae bacterium]|jgi:sugar phosphate permease|nr:MFS transporter [Rhodospirillaceae bacterium]MBT5459518.1 MFS transporter [Rhodospirillaceae bacterium]
MPLSVYRTILTVLVPFGLGYYLSYLYRTVNIVIAKPLATDLSLSAADLGLLTSIYFIVFAVFQTPLGVILDRYGPRRVQIVLLMFAAAGGALFAVSEQFFVLAIARGLIGLGVSGCLMAAIQGNVLWFPKDRLPLVNGFTAAFGTFGALSATVPVEYLYGAYGWRPIFILLAVAALVVAFLIFLVVPEHGGRGAEDPGKTTSLRSQFGDIGQIYTSRFFWRLGIVSFVHNSVFLSYQALWMGPWLRDVAGLTLPSIAETLLWFNVGMFVGVICIGVLADRVQALGINPMVVMGSGIGLSILVQSQFALEQVEFATLLCFAFGFLGSSPLLVWSIFALHFPRNLVGRVNTAQNMLSFIGAFAVQWGVGIIINMWPESPDSHYDPAGHQAAFVTMICIEIIAFVWFLWPGRKRSNQTD